MKTIKYFLIMMFLTIVIASCKKNNTSIYGTYFGTFTVIYPDHTFTGKTTVNLYRNGQYNCSRGTDYIPAGGSGTFTKTTNKMTFKDINNWSADFDWNLILNGDYDFTFDGENLKLTAFKNKVAQYEYNLIKQ